MADTPAVPEYEGLQEAARLGVMWARLQVRLLEMAGDAMRGRGPSGVSLLGESFERIQEALDQLETRCRYEAASLRVTSRFDPAGAMVERNEASTRRGVRLLAVGGPRTLVNNPFWASEAPFGRIAPVYGQMILMDRSCVMLPGPITATGGETAWLSTRADLVQAACELWDATLAASSAVDDSVPRYNERQLEVARRRGRGWTNARIARDLGISARTVTADLGRLPIINP